MTDESQITEDDWAAAMNEQADAEEAPAPAASAPASDSDDPFAAAKAKQFEQFDSPSKTSLLSDFEMILDIPVNLTVELGRTRIAIRDLLQLAHGSVVELDGLAGEPMDVLVNGTLIAQGEVVVVNDKFGIRLTDIITPAERMRKVNR